MVDCQYSPDNYKTLKISITAITKISKRLKFIPDYLKTKKMSENAFVKDHLS